VENVSTTPQCWSHVGDRQEKVCLWNPPPSWEADSTETEPPSPKRRIALARAVRLFDLARERSERERFIQALSGTGRLDRPWLRKIISTLRGSSISD
jgi:hypothetical protein